MKPCPNASQHSERLQLHTRARRRIKQSRPRRHHRPHGAKPARPREVKSHRADEQPTRSKPCQPESMQYFMARRPEKRQERQLPPHMDRACRCPELLGRAPASPPAIGGRPPDILWEARWGANSGARGCGAGVVTKFGSETGRRGSESGESWRCTGAARRLQWCYTVAALREQRASTVLAPHWH